MKTKIFLYVSMILWVSFISCGKDDKDEPSSDGSSSYEIRFLTGPLAGKEFKASGLTREQITSLYTEESSSNKGVITQILTNNFTVSAILGLNANNQVMPFSIDAQSLATQLILSFKDNGNNYVYMAESGSPSLKDLKIATLGNSGGNSIGLTTYELSFENIPFSDQIASGNGEFITAQVSGKLVIK